MHRKTRRRFPAQEKIRIVLEGLRGELSYAALCRREEISSKLCRGMGCADVHQVLDQAIANA